MAFSQFNRFGKFRNRGRGVRRQPGVMNGYEKRYAAILGEQMRRGEIEWFQFDSVKLRLAEKCFYSPDFIVMTASGEIEIHEVKGSFIEDDAKVKLKVAAAMFPFRFRLCQLKKVKDPWIITVIGGDEAEESEDQEPAALFKDEVK